MKKLSYHVKLYFLKGLYSLLDILTNITHANPYFVRQKIYIGAAIISITLSFSLCTSPADKVKIKNNKNNAISEVTSTCYLPVPPKELIHQPTEKGLNKRSLPPKIKPLTKEDTLMPIVSCYMVERRLEKSTLAEDKNDTLFFVEQMPSFKGGIDSMRKFITRNLKYPENAGDLEITGKVYMQFTITDKGDVVNIKVLRSLYPPFDNEAIRVIKLMPKWNPGVHNGQNVNVYFTLPIHFKMSE